MFIFYASPKCSKHRLTTIQLSVTQKRQLALLWIPIVIGVALKIIMDASLHYPRVLSSLTLEMPNEKYSRVGNYGNPL